MKENTKFETLAPIVCGTVSSVLSGLKTRSLGPIGAEKYVHVTVRFT